MNDNETPASLPQEGSIYLSSLNGIETAIIWAKAYLDVGVVPYVCIPARIVEDVRPLLRMHDLIPFVLEPLSAGERGWASMHSALCNYASSLVMGDNIDNALLSAPTDRWRRGIVYRLRRFPIKPSSRVVNQICGALFSRKTARRFPTRHVLVVSFPETPLILCHGAVIVDTIVDSWDHSVRRTAGYPTRTAIAWNRDLAEDWQTYQGARALALGPPVKLQYALTSGTPATTLGARTLLYPVATTSHYEAWLNEELKVIDVICSAAGKAGWQVLLKPKPMSRASDLAPLLGRYSGVRFGAFHESRGPLDYHLNDAYNRTRLGELRESCLVVNTVSTFGLDAACAGVPLLQLDLGGLHDLPSLSAAARNHHLRTWLYPNARDSVIRPVNMADFALKMEEWLRLSDLDPARRASARLRTWVDAERRPLNDVVGGLLANPRRHGSGAARRRTGGPALP